jgi:hypothetical protein
MKKMLFSFATVLWCVIQAQAITFKENLLFSAKLEGAEVVPAITTNAKGIASLMLNKTRDSIAVNMSFNGLSGIPTNVWLYQGPAGSNGGQLIDLTAYLTGNRISMHLNGASVTGNMANLFKEQIYLLVSTAANPSGEIRGQIKLESDWSFAADLTGQEAIPAVSGNAYGLGSFSLSLDKTKLSYRIICQNLTSAITGAMLHFGAIGQTGTIADDLTASVNGNIISGTLVPTSMMLDSLFARKIYLNITTATNPTGELRSQLINYKGLTFEAIIDGGQMVPAIASSGQGISLIRLSPTMDTLYYDAVMDNINTNIDYAHLHVGNAGFAYGALQVDFTSDINGHRIKGMKTGSGVSANTIKRLLISNLTFIVHTVAYPNGEIRGAVIRYAREGLTMNCTGSQVVSPVATPAYGSGIVSVGRGDDNIHYMWVVGGLSSVATGAHFNHNIVGQNGPIIYDMSTFMSAQNGDASAFGYWKSTDSNPFLVSHSKQFQTDSIYLEITNALYPNGELRGQVVKGTIFYAPTSIVESAAVLFNVSVYPVPAQNEMTIQYATNSSQVVRIQMTDMLGKLVFASTVENSRGAQQIQVDVSNLEAGVYLMSIMSEGTVQTIKMIKE